MQGARAGDAPDLRRGAGEPDGAHGLDRLPPSTASLADSNELAPYAGEIRRAIEIGRGLDKVLLADHGAQSRSARRLFADRARLAMSIHDDGRIVIPDKKGPREITIRSRFGMTVWDDYVRFADPQGTDLAKVSIPWIAPEDRKELARRIGQLVDRDQQDPIAWPPKLAAGPST
ncbi:MAG: hypothetical protein IPQ07_26900 [Myxococcales bacterium]|nr:hypothetical protein [Myxococcales bacterium]